MAKRIGPVDSGKITVVIAEEVYNHLLLLGKKAPAGTAVRLVTMSNFDNDMDATITITGLVVPTQIVKKGKQVSKNNILSDANKWLLIDSSDTIPNTEGSLVFRLENESKKYRLQYTNLFKGIVYETADIALEINRNGSYDASLTMETVMNEIDFITEEEDAVTTHTTTLPKGKYGYYGYNDGLYKGYQASIFDGYNDDDF